MHISKWFLLLPLMFQLSGCGAPSTKEPTSLVTSTSIVVTVPTSTPKAAADTEPFNFVDYSVSLLKLQKSETTAPIRYAIIIDRCLNVTIPSDQTTIELPVKFTFCNERFIDPTAVDLFDKVHMGIDETMANWKAKGAEVPGLIEVPTISQLREKAEVAEDYSGYIVFELPKSGSLYALDTPETAIQYYETTPKATRLAILLGDTSSTYRFTTISLPENPLGVGALGLYLSSYAEVHREYLFRYVEGTPTCMYFTLPENQLDLDLHSTYGADSVQRVMKFETTAEYSHCQ